MAGTSRVVYPYIKKKIGLLERDVCFLSSAGNVGDFCSFKGYGAGDNRLKILNSQKLIFHISCQTKCIFVTN